jgi:hypothetical protein
MHEFELVQPTVLSGTTMLSEGMPTTGASATLGADPHPASVSAATTPTTATRRGLGTLSGTRLMASLVFSWLVAFGRCYLHRTRPDPVSSNPCSAG